MSQQGSRRAPIGSLLRDRDADTTVSNTELFFDLVYVVTVTEISVVLRENPSWHGAVQAFVLLAMVWNAWVYTTWVTNWLDPERAPTRLMLLAIMAGSMVLAAGIAQAYEDRGLWVGVAYAVMQVGRSLYTVWATRGDPLQRNYLRILCWCAVSGSLAIGGGLAEGDTRLALFAGAVLVDIVGGFAQFWTPGLGRTETRDWTIDGAHFAERCQAFVLIALGESLVGIGAPLISAGHVSTSGIVGLTGAFVGVAVLFLIYFDHWAERGTEAIGLSDDPGRLAARAYHLAHPVMIGGIILVAAGNEEVLGPLLGHGEQHADVASIGWFCAGGGALFVLGHAAYVQLIGGVAGVAHLVTAVALLAVAAVAAPAHLGGLAVGLLTGATLLVFYAVDTGRRSPR